MPGLAIDMFYILWCPVKLLREAYKTATDYTWSQSGFRRRKCDIFGKFATTVATTKYLWKLTEAVPRTAAKTGEANPIMDAIKQILGDLTAGDQGRPLVRDLRSSPASAQVRPAHPLQHGERTQPPPDRHAHSIRLSREPVSQPCRGGHLPPSHLEGWGPEQLRGAFRRHEG
jgi:hypothetical protein